MLKKMEKIGRMKIKKKNLKKLRKNFGQSRKMKKGLVIKILRRRGEESFKKNGD